MRGDFADQSASIQRERHGLRATLAAQTGACFWQDNVCVACRHSLIFEGGGSGCVYAYNYCIEDNNSDESPGWVTDNVVMHASHPYLNLFEGNHFHKWDAGHVHGSSSHNTAFRNEITGGPRRDQRGSSGLGAQCAIHPGLQGDFVGTMELL